MKLKKLSKPAKLVMLIMSLSTISMAKDTVKIIKQTTDFTLMTEDKSQTKKSVFEGGTASQFDEKKIEEMDILNFAQYISTNSNGKKEIKMLAELNNSEWENVKNIGIKKKIQQIINNNNLSEEDKEMRDSLFVCYKQIYHMFDERTLSINMKELDKIKSEEVLKDLYTISFPIIDMTKLNNDIINKISEFFRELYKIKSGELRNKDIYTISLPNTDMKKLKNDILNKIAEFLQTLDKTESGELRRELYTTNTPNIKTIGAFNLILKKFGQPLTLNNLNENIKNAAKDFLKNKKNKYVNYCEELIRKINIKGLEFISDSEILKLQRKSQILEEGYRIIGDNDAVLEIYKKRELIPLAKWM